MNGIDAQRAAARINQGGVMFNGLVAMPEAIEAELADMLRSTLSDKKAAQIGVVALQMWERIAIGPPRPTRVTPLNLRVPKKGLILQ